jgi:hypothetical protein
VTSFTLIGDATVVRQFPNLNFDVTLSLAGVGYLVMIIGFLIKLVSNDAEFKIL